ncbi:MAG: PEGA domain-containing protein [Kofleriaceae bacterium]
MVAPRALALLVVAACASAPAHPIAVAVLVDGEHAAPLAANAVPGLELHAVELAAPSEAPDSTSATLARARTAYAKGNHDGCRSQLATIELPAVFAAGQRAAAARALTLEAACAYQGLGVQDARVAAGRLAAFGLELPADAVAYEVEQLIGDAIAAASKAPRVHVAIRGQLGARVSLDGKPALCVVPCSVEAIAGDHVVAVEADGFEPAWRIVRVPDTDTSVTIAQEPASLARASLQWRARLGRGQPATDAIGAALIARLASGQPRVAYLHAGSQLTGTLIVDGTVRAASTGTAAPALMRELAYDAGLLQRPRIWQRPWFWIAVAGAALAASGAIVLVTYEPEPQTMVHF